MDKKKIISSLTMAGVLASTATGAIFAADEVKTPVLGEFTNLVDGVTAIPVKLQSKSDKLTGKDLKIAYPGATVSAEDTEELHTGDVVRINGQRRTIVICGDANKDGSVDIFDVTTIVGNITGTKLTGVELAAADLNRDGVADIFDITNIVGAISGDNYPGLNVTLPENAVKVADREITAANTIVLKFNSVSAKNYTPEVVNNKTGNKIAVTNVVWDGEKKTATVTLAENLISIATDRDQTYTVRVYNQGALVSEDTNVQYYVLADVTSALIDVDNVAMQKIVNTNNVNSLAVKVVLANANLVDTTVSVTLKDTAKREVTGTARIPAGVSEVIVNNFTGLSKLEDGELTVTVKVLDAKNGNVVEKTMTGSEFTKNTEKLEIAYVTAVRNGTKLGAVTPVMIDNATTSKTYVKVLPTTSAKPSASEITSTEDNLLAKVQADVELANNTEYTVYVVVENADGVQSDRAEVNLPSAYVDATLKNVKEVVAVDGEAGKYKWTDSDNTQNKNDGKIGGYRVNLYATELGDNSDKVLVATKTVGANVDTVNFLTEIKDYVKENNILNYSVGVTALGNNSKIANSATETVSDAVEAERVEAPDMTACITVIENGKMMLVAPAKDANVVAYDVYVYKYDKDTKTYGLNSIAKGTTASNTTKVDLTNVLAGQAEGKYQLKAVAVSGKTEIADSEESDSSYEIYYVKDVPTINYTVKSSQEVEVKFYDLEDYTVDTDKFTYTLDFKKKSDNTSIGSYDLTVDSASEYDAQDRLFTKVINGLEAETEYVATVTVKTTKQEIVKSADVTIKTIKTPVTTNGAEMTVADSNAVGNIYYNTSNSKLYINGAEVTDKTAANYNDVVALVRKLKAGDTVTIDAAGKVTAVTMNNKAGVDFGTVLKDAKLTIEDAASGSTVNGTFKSVDVKADVDFGGVQKDVALKAVKKVTAPTGSVISVEKSGATVNNVTLTGTDTAIKVTVTENGISIGNAEELTTVTASKATTIEFAGSKTGAVKVVNGATKTADVAVKVTGNPIDLTVAANAEDDNKGYVVITEANYTDITLEDGAVVKFKGTKNIESDGVTYTIKAVNEVTVTAVEEGKLLVNGAATITTEDITDAAQTTDLSGEQKTVILDAGNKDNREDTIGTTKTLTIEANKGTVNYSVDDKHVVTIVITATDGAATATIG